MENYPENQPPETTPKEGVIDRLKKKFIGRPDPATFEDAMPVGDVANLINQYADYTHGKDRDGYDFFPSPESRQELYMIGRRMSEYVRKEGIGTVCFVDRSARPAYLALTEYWNSEYPDEKKPDIRFINPKGCIAIEDVIEGRVDFISVALNDELKDGVPEGLLSIRSGYEIVDEIRNGLEKSEHKDDPILLFDACIHSGLTLAPVIASFYQAGVNPDSLRIGTVSTEDLKSTIISPDFVVMKKRPEGVCYPFGRDAMVQKLYGSVTSERNQNSADVNASVRIREEIKRAMREQIDARKNRRIRIPLRSWLDSLK